MTVDTPTSEKTTMTQEVKITENQKGCALLKIFPLSDELQPQIYILSDKCSIGRAHGNTIRLEDTLMSRFHCELVKGPDGTYNIKDKDSKNGVFVCGIRVSSSHVVDGDVIRLGSSIFVFREISIDLPPYLSHSEGFVCVSPPFRHVVELCKTIAKTSATVLLQGETGTGKEVLARYIHQNSGLRGRFIPLNCAAIAPGLFETTLFGHRRGAFTGATTDFEGHIRTASNGTLFLDEIGELPFDTQAKLLRFLDNNEITPVGACEPIHVNVRVVAATNRDLESQVSQGRFRKDLYGRLAQCVVKIPPLRERPEDVIVMALSRLYSQDIELTPDCAESLVLYDWPYNMREVISTVNELMMKVEKKGVIRVEHLPIHLRSLIIPRKDERVDKLRSQITKEFLENTLKECNNCIAEVARRLKKDRKQIYRYLKMFGLRH